jgi:hypothetical protein
LGITILRKTRCVLLHFDSSKRCVCPLYKFLYAFKVVKLFLKHPVYITSNVAFCDVTAIGYTGTFTDGDLLDEF